MKKILPFVFPFVALVIVLLLAVRWYNSKTIHNQDKIADFGDNIKIEDLSQLGKQSPSLTAAKDLKSLTLKGEKEQGTVRYEVRDGEFEFTVSANLPQLSVGFYQVWLKQINGEAKKKAFVLVDTKGGYTGSAAVSVDALPFEIVVTKESQKDGTSGTVIMSVSVPAESTR